MITYCKLNLDDLDSWWTGKVKLSGWAEPGGWLIQCIVQQSYWDVGDRIWWDHPAEDFQPDDGADYRGWVNVRPYSEELDGKN